MLVLTTSEKVKNVLDYRDKKCLKMKYYFKIFLGEKVKTQSLEFLVLREKKFTVIAVILDSKLYSYESSSFLKRVLLSIFVHISRGAD